MDATTMHSTTPLLDSVQTTFPSITFQAGEQFEWQPNESVIIYDPDDPEFDAHLLHEIGHATLKHSTYDRDIDLIAMERDAWHHARMRLGPQFQVAINGDTIHHAMDTYRDWLHQRSTCPHCNSSGLQMKRLEYKCVTCRKSWQVNEARSCRLRRHRLT